MKTNQKRHFVIIAAVLLISMMSLAVSAYSNSFSIPTNETTWNGKDNDVLWGFDTGDTVTWELENTSSGSRKLTGQLKYVVTLWPDTNVGSALVVEGENGTSGTATFVPHTDRGYYPVVTCSSRVGATGIVSAWQ